MGNNLAIPRGDNSPIQKNYPYKKAALMIALEVIFYGIAASAGLYTLYSYGFAPLFLIKVGVVSLAPLLLLTLTTLFLLRVKKVAEGSLVNSSQDLPTTTPQQNPTATTYPGAPDSDHAPVKTSLTGEIPQDDSPGSSSSKSSPEAKRTTDSTYSGLTPTQLPALRTIDALESHPPKVVAEIYAVNNPTGLIYQDQQFRFNEHLKEINNQALIISPDDIYIEIAWNGSGDDPLTPLRDKMGIGHNIMLPSSLFKNIGTDQRVCFYYDDLYCELICNQESHPNEKLRDTNFSDQIKNRIAFVRQERNPPAFLSDLFKDQESEWDIHLEEKPFGAPIARILWETSEKVELNSEGFELYKKDQQDNGPYKFPLLIESRIIASNAETSRTRFIMPEIIHYQKPIPLDKFHLLESRYKGLRQWWIILPHVPEENRLQENEKPNFKFNLKEGDRLLSYRYGQCFTLTVPDEASHPTLYYSSPDHLGFLTLSFET